VATYIIIIIAKFFQKQTFIVMNNFDEQIKNLSSKNDIEVLDAIEKLRINGNENAIPFLIELLKNNKSEEVKNDVANLLFELKNEKALPILIKEFNKPENLEYQRLLVSACWESGLDCTPYLFHFIELAIKSDYMVCLECLTVIENLKGPFNPEILDKTISLMRIAADNNEDGKFELLHCIWEVLVDFKE